MRQPAPPRTSAGITRACPAPHHIHRCGSSQVPADAPTAAGPGTRLGRGHPAAAVSRQSWGPLATNPAGDHSPRSGVIELIAGSHPVARPDRLARDADGPGYADAATPPMTCRSRDGLTRNAAAQVRRPQPRGSVIACGTALSASPASARTVISKKTPRVRRGCCSPSRSDPCRSVPAGPVRSRGPSASSRPWPSGTTSSARGGQRAARHAHLRLADPRKHDHRELVLPSPGVRDLRKLGE